MINIASKKASLLFTIAMCFVCSSRIYGQATNPDNSSYNLAMQAYRSKNYVECYKQLIIFKYTNLSLLRQSNNQNILKQLDNKIETLGDFLNQGTQWVQIKAARGFTDNQMDSSYKTQISNLRLESIRIH
jgi:hypothetical protein